MMIADCIGYRVRRCPQCKALVDTVAGRRYTYKALCAEVNRMARYLEDVCAISKGDRVAVLGRNRMEHLTLFFAAGRLGAILVPLNHKLTSNELMAFIQDAAPRVLFTDRTHRHQAEALVSSQQPRIRCLDFDTDVAAVPTSGAEPGEAGAAPAAMHPGDPHMIIYTSGTTAQAKGVVLTHGMMTQNAVNTVSGWELTQKDTTLIHTELSYTAAWNVLALPLFYCGGTVVLMQEFDADAVLDLIDREGVTVLFGVPTMLQMMAASSRFANTDLTRLRKLLSGGAPLPRETYEIYRDTKNIELREGYGLTEVGPNNFRADGPFGSVGRPMPNVQVRIADVEGNPLPAGKIGELWIKGAHVSPGYWNKPVESRAAMHGDWFRSGDFAAMDEDGRVTITGRIKDIFISGGINIIPAEVENAIAEHPAVSAVAVIGVPDAKWGESGKAVVELYPGARLTLEELQAFLRRRLGPFKIPKYMVVVDRIPRTAVSGKVIKSRLTERHGRPDNH